MDYCEEHSTLSKNVDRIIVGMFGDLQNEKEGFVHEQRRYNDQNNKAIEDLKQKVLDIRGTIAKALWAFFATFATAAAAAVAENIFHVFK